MARAKRTDRTEARRRYHAELAAAEPGETTIRPNVLAGPAKDGAAATPPAGARPSIGAAFRGAVRPFDLKGDLRSLPVIIRERGFLISVAVAVAATAVFVFATNELGASLNFALSDPLADKTMPTATSISYLAVSLFVAPPPAAGGFLIGFFAKRGSWLTGLIFGMVAAACYSWLIISPAGRLLTGQNAPDTYVLQAWIAGPVGAALFASAAAWYRRFLDLANPNRGQRRPARQTQKTQNRGGAKRR